MVHCHIEHHMANGMMTTIWYDGYEPTGPAAALFASETDHALSHSGGHDGDHAESPTPAPTQTTSTEPAAQGEVVINTVDDRFDPASVTVPVGTTVTWINKGANWHSIASFDGSFESGRIEPGDRFSITFETPGTYQYICKHHAMQGMIATITVVAA